MAFDVRQFLDSLDTAARIKSAFAAVGDSAASKSSRDLATYANSLGYDFTADEASLWLQSFHSSISDSDLRLRYHQKRLRTNNDWAAFFSLEWEMMIEIPDEQYLGNWWEIDGLDKCDKAIKGKKLVCLWHYLGRLFGYIATTLCVCV